MAKRGQGEGTISKRPDGTWWARISLGYDENGKRKRKAFYGKTRKEVQEKLTAALNEINNNTYIEPSKMTVGQWMDIWVNEYKLHSVKPQTYMKHQDNIRNYIKPYIGSLKLQNLRNDDIQKCINLLANKLSAATVDIAYTTLHSALEQAVDNDLISKNPASKITLPRQEPPEIRVFTQEEQKNFVKVTEQHRNGDLFVLMLATGLRVGEALALTWDDIDLEKGMLNVNKTQVILRNGSGNSPKTRITTGSPKTKSSNRKVPLIPEMISLLSARKDQQRIELLDEKYVNNNLVFSNPKGGRLRQSTVDQTFKRCIGKIGIDPSEMHLHCLRHTFATRGLENGIPLKIMQELLGHSSIKMTADLYTHVLPDEKTNAIKKLSKSFN